MADDAVIPEVQKGIIMSLNPTGTTNYNWNYSNPQKEGYSNTLVGTVLAIQEVQKRAFTMNGQPGAPEFWPEGNPKMNIRIALATPEGQLKTFTFQPAGKKQRETGTGVHMQLFALTGNTDMMNLIGKTIQIQTQEAPQGTKYAAGNPRPFSVTEIQGGPYQLSMPLPAEFTVPQVLCNDAASGGQVMPQQTQQAAPPIMNNGMYAAPGMTPQQVVSQNTTPYVPQAQPAQQMQPVQTQPQPVDFVPQAQPVQAQPAMQQQPAGTVQPMIPAGMDPQVAAAMANVGATNVQEVTGGAVYDQDIPF